MKTRTLLPVEELILLKASCPADSLQVLSGKKQSGAKTLNYSLRLSCFEGPAAFQTTSFVTRCNESAKRADPL